MAKRVSRTHAGVGGGRRGRRNAIFRDDHLAPVFVDRGAAHGFRRRPAVSDANGPLLSAHQMDRGSPGRQSCRMPHWPAESPRTPRRSSPGVGFASRLIREEHLGPVGHRHPRHDDAAVATGDWAIRRSPQLRDAERSGFSRPLAARLATRRGSSEAGCSLAPLRWGTNCTSPAGRETHRHAGSGPDHPPTSPGGRLPRPWRGPALGTSGPLGTLSGVDARPDAETTATTSPASTAGRVPAGRRLPTPSDLKIPPGCRRRSGHRHHRGGRVVVVISGVILLEDGRGVRCRQAQTCIDERGQDDERAAQLINQRASRPTG